MRKALTVLLLAVALVWQTPAMSHNAPARDQTAGLAHVVMHFEKELHHHYDDGSLHHDESNESIQHVYADAYANPPGVVPAHATPTPPNACLVASAAPAQPAHDSPVLEGPRRPPRLTA